MAHSETGNWFEVERSAATAATAARQAGEWSSLVDALRLLMEARDHLAAAARNGRRVQILEDEESLAVVQEPGRYLLRPPLVGRSAKDLSLRARDNEIPMLILCREPTTQLARCPIVSLGEGVTVRMHVDEPSNPDKPTCQWFDDALDQLGHHAIGGVDPAMAPLRLLDAMIMRVETIPHHSPLHVAAIEAAKAAMNGDG
ncbi:MAG: hypothetical protein QGH76_00115 [Phycisphaerales bacterium]|jgi:hypothetical protein|nr:hypothetical protein [Phycisphaerales bacterium]